MKWTPAIAGGMLGAMVFSLAAQEPFGCNQYGSPPAVTVPPVSTRPDCARAGATLLGDTGDSWSDSQGTPRYACVWYPKRIPNSCPLMIYLHTSSSNATQPAVFRSRVSNTSLDGGRSTGFCLLSVNGTNTYRNYPPIDSPSTGWDNWYRAMLPEPGFAQNVDAQAIDHFVAEVSAKVAIDTSRVYMTGWSNGGAMNVLYALNRTDIAAVAVYSAPDPWAFLQDPCEQVPQVSNIRVPIMLVHKDNDLWGLCPNQERLVSRLRSVGVPVTDILLSSSNQWKQVQSCDPAGGTDPNGDASNPGGAAATLAHDLWPTAWTDSMISFLGAHPTTAASQASR